MVKEECSATTWSRSESEPPLNHSPLIAELPLVLDICNELCNHASNILFIYVRLSILSCFMLTLTGHYGQFNFTCI